MKPAPFEFVTAVDAGDALRLIGEAGPLAKFVAGGQSLGPMLALRLARPSHLVELARAGDMRGTADEGDAIVYGAAVTHAEIEDGTVPDATGGWLAAIARGIAYRAVRNRGTIGGSLVHADPAADWVVTLTALGAELLLVSKAGTRAVPLERFILGPLTSDLRDAEMLTGVRIAKRQASARWGYWKFTAKTGEFAKASAAVLIDAARGERRIVVGAMERAPLVLGPAATAAIFESPAAIETVLTDAAAPLPPEGIALHVAALRRALALAVEGPSR